MPAIAVLGCGRIGGMHATNIQANPRATLAGVFDIHMPSAETVANQLKTQLYDTAEAVFADNTVDAVLIATSTPTHVDLIQQAISAGKAVLCEKPIDMSLERVDACAKAVENTTLPVMLGFCRRFDPGHRAARQTLLDGEIGELHQVIITSRDPGMAPAAYIESSGGIFRDMTIHDLDLARFMLGEEVKAVAAHGTRLVDPALMTRCNDYDTVVVTLMSDSGKQAVITNSREAVYGYDQRVELFGSKGMVISENHRVHQAVKYTPSITGAASPLQHFFIERYRDAFIAEIDSFVDAVEGKATPEVTFRDGRQAQMLADACFRSLEEGRTVQCSEFDR